MDFEVKRCTRSCRATGRELAEGETFYSVLVAEGAEVVRHDYSADAWQGPPAEGVIAWWQSQVPTREARRNRMAPNDVLLELFEEVREQPEQAEMVYVLALLLVRRRVFRLEETRSDAGQEALVLYCPRQEATYTVPVATPEEARVAEIQESLGTLLFAGAD